VHYLPSPFPHLSCHLMTLSSHHGRWRWTTPTPAKPMPGVVALPHWCPTPLAAMACLLHCCCCPCHLHSLRRWQNDRRRQQGSTTAGRRLHRHCQLREEGCQKKGVIFVSWTKLKVLFFPRDNTGDKTVLSHFVWDKTVLLVCIARG
jgi:hypothetical protein